jgi:hypothetical protein
LAGSTVKDIVDCVLNRISRNGDLLRRLVSSALQECRGEDCLPWETGEWQRAKSIIGDSIAECICTIAGCRVYRLEMHGGEPSLGLGDKDADLAVDCDDSSFDVEALEEMLEKLLSDIVGEIVGGNAYEKLKLPNIVELHTTREFLIKKYVEAGPPYAFRVC